MKLADCRLPGLERAALCGSHEVWEDRQGRAGRRIALQIAVIPARRRGAEPDPLVVLAGGPGQGAIALAPQVIALFSRLNDARDIVLVDQRGTGGSNPLDCDPDDGASLQSVFEDSLPEKMVRDCLASLDADPRHYATTTAVADLDEVLGAMGYARVNLWGGSYGTRVALEFVRRHPGRVRTATLDGVAPMGMKLPLSFVADGEAAFDRLVADCEADPAVRQVLSRPAPRPERAARPAGEEARARADQRSGHRRAAERERHGERPALGALPAPLRAGTREPAAARHHAGGRRRLQSAPRAEPGVHRRT